MNNDELIHYGTLEKSGRFKWGSGEDPYQRLQPFGSPKDRAFSSPSGFMSTYHNMKSKGLSEKEIADELGLTINELRSRRSLASDEIKQNNINQALTLKDKGYSNIAIAQRMNVTEGAVRSWLKKPLEERKEITKIAADVLKKSVDEQDFIDVGAGVEHYLGISGTRLKTALEYLKNEGYQVYNIPVEQPGTGKDTTVKVLAKPGIEWKDVAQNKENIGLAVGSYSEDGGKTWYGIEPPKSVNSDRIMVRYAEEGGKYKDGVIELRRECEDLSLGSARYGQVRIAVDGSHYLKGMAVYGDKMPDGVDIIFNTNKHNTGNKLDAMKKLENDPDNPFKATIRQRHYIDKNGKEQLSPLNIVASGDKLNLEGRWDEWNKTLSSQFLSKQPPSLAKKQLNLKYAELEDEYNEIMSYTNPAIKKKMLLSFAESCDKEASHLSAAAFPRQATSVILPLTSLKNNEVYAPNFRNGESVVLIRYPHGGTFEIPQLKVNNQNKEGKHILGNAKDAIGINHTVAERLSGADFDGDTVIVIPTDGKKIKTSSPLNGLKNFDAKEKYTYPDPDYPPKIKDRTKGKLMGSVTNLINDMTIKGAPQEEICRAVRHSMVVIDAQKHHLNYKQSYIDNNIQQLVEKYQASPGKSKPGGASTLISRAGSPVRVPQRKDRLIIDPETGKQLYDETGKIVRDKKGRPQIKTQEVSRMSLVDDARELISSKNTPIENVYADHANKLKSLANQARKDYLNIQPHKINTSASEVYKKEIDSLRGKVILAEKNAPLERQAIILTNGIIKAKFKEAKAKGERISDKDLKKIKGQALNAAREKVGAKKQTIHLTDKEWQAIQSGGVSYSLLTKIINNMKDEELKSWAIPKTVISMSSSKIARAKAMLNSGYTQADVADVLGVSVSTLKKSLKDE